MLSVWTSLKICHLGKNYEQTIFLSVMLLFNLEELGHTYSTLVRQIL